MAPDLFEVVRRRLAGKTVRSAPRQIDHPDFPLRRIVKCEHCGTPLTWSWSTGRNGWYGYYRCRQFGKEHVSVRREVVEQQLEAYLAGQSVAPGVLALFRTIVEDVWE